MLNVIAFTWLLRMFMIGQFGVVSKAYYMPEENKKVEVAVKTVKCVLLIL